MMLRDYFCLCGAELVDQLERPICEDCGRVMQPTCNGGVGARLFRHADLPPGHSRYWEDQIEARVDECCVSQDGDFADNGASAPKRLDGKPLINFDRIAERHERLRFERRARCGQNPIRSRR